MVGVQQAGTEVAAYAIGVDQRVEMAARVEREFPQAPRVRGAHALLQPFLIAAHPHVRLAAVAARSAPAEQGLLQQHHLDAALGQMQRRRQAGETAADDADFSAAVDVQRRRGYRLGRGRCVIRGRMPATRIERMWTVAFRHL